ncbi:hypothetical protein GCM10010517_35390 [Streptosporangium fragile]|uniref:Uncharacterized protein n=1 Tax=Streptosporangium fragile TaxID=46186 RepID=A0ABN3VYL3_9ACTN
MTATRSAGGLGDHAEVVGDDERGEPALPVDLADDPEDRGLGDHVERGRRLVQHDEVGVEDEREHDAHPLAHATRQLVLVGVEHPGAVQAHPAEQVPGLPDQGAQVPDLVGAAEVEQLLADRLEGVEGVLRGLEDVSDVPSPRPAQLLAAQLHDVAETVDLDAARADPAGRLHRVEQ